MGKYIKRQEINKTGRNTGEKIHSVYFTNAKCKPSSEKVPFSFHFQTGLASKNAHFKILLFSASYILSPPQWRETAKRERDKVNGPQLFPF